MRPFRLTLMAGVCGTAVFSVSCIRKQPSADPLSMQRIVIAGRVSDPAAIGSMTLNFCDVVNDDRAGISFAEDGSFHVTSDILLGHEVTINAGHWIKFYIEPGDSVYMTIDPAKFYASDPEGVLFSGDRADFNNQYRKFFLQAREWGNFSFEDMPDPQAYMAQIKEQVGAQIAQMEQYKAREGMLPGLEDFLRRDIRFIAANGIDFPEEGKKEVLSDPFWEREDAGNFRTMMFPYYLGGYAVTLLYTNPEYVRLAGEAQDPAQRVRKALDILLAEPAGLCRDVMIWQMLRWEVYEEENSELYTALPPLTEIFTEPVFARQLHVLYERLSEPIVFPETVLDGIYRLDDSGAVVGMEPQDIFAHIASEYAGKVVYLDLWATWCGPCLAAVPYMHALERELEGEDVVFVSLCMQSSRDNWLSTLEKHSIGGERYYLDDASTRLFMGVSSLSGFPTYALIDPSGQIVTMRAPRPQDREKALESIRALL